MIEGLQRLLEADRLVQVGLRQADEMIARANERSMKAFEQTDHSPEEIAEIMASIHETNAENRVALARELWLTSLAFLSAHAANKGTSK